MAYTLFVVLAVIAALLMIAIVLIQESKGGGLSSQFSSTNSIMGVRKTTDIVEKATWGLVCALVVFSVACAYVAPQSVSTESILERTAIKTQTTNPQTTPGFGVGQQQNATQNDAQQKQEISTQNTTATTGDAQ